MLLDSKYAAFAWIDLGLENENENENNGEDDMLDTLVDAPASCHCTSTQIIDEVQSAGVQRDLSQLVPATEYGETDKTHCSAL